MLSFILITFQECKIILKVNFKLSKELKAQNLFSQELQRFKLKLSINRQITKIIPKNSQSTLTTTHTHSFRSINHSSHQLG
jgi:hypothetical protein